MAEFDIEEMRYLPSPYEILEEVSLPTSGLIRARIIDPASEDSSVFGYDYMWNQTFAFEAAENERLKVVSVAIGEKSCDATLALILPPEDQEKIREMRREHEVQLLDMKKHFARMRVMQEAELTDDAIELIKTEVTVEHPELHFPPSLPHQTPPGS